MIHIILEGTGGELDRRTVGNETEIKAAVAELVATTEYFNPGDTIRIVEE